MKRILCYGDSNTFGYDPVTGERYPSKVRWTGRLQEQLGQDYCVVEEACNGRTACYTDPKEEWKNGMYYLKPCLNSQKPLDAVIIMLGTNDLKTMFHASVKEIAAGVGHLVDTVFEFTEEKQGFKPVVILVSPPAIGTGIIASSFKGSFDSSAAAHSLEFSGYYRSIAKEKGCFFLDAAAIISPSEEDSLHLMPEAHAALADELEKIVRKAV